MGSCVGSLLSIAVAAALGGGDGQSPSSRAAALEAARVAKAASTTPFTPSKPEAILFQIEDQYLIERFLNAPRGPFLRLGGLPTGSGQMIGPAFRQSNNTYAATITSAGSLLYSWELTASLAFPDLANDNAFVEVRARKRELPLEDFSGLGPEAQDENRTSYRYRDTLAELQAGLTPTDWLTIAGAVAHISPAVGPRGGPEGGREGVPSIETIFDDTTAPGLDAQPAFVRLGFSVSIDDTDEKVGSRSGTRLYAGWHRYSDQDLDAYSFDQWTIDARHYLPVLHGARTLAVRVLFEALEPEDGHEVPFYYRPTLGGPETLRGLRPYRFRDRSVAVFQAEYRWPINAFLGGVFFYDAGTVADAVERLSTRSLQQDFGLGLRVGFLSLAFLRAEAVFGAPGGPTFLLRFGDVF